MGEARADEPHGRHDHQLDRLLERVRRHLGARSGRGPARVPDDDVDTAERLQGRGDDPLEVLREADVPAHGERSDPVGLAFQHVAPAGEHRHVGALAGERFGACEPEARRGAADERRAAFQP